MKIIGRTKFFDLKTGPYREHLEDKGVLDMLRYDSCFYKDDVVAFPTISETRYGGLGGRVTEGRWRSFLFGLLEVKPGCPRHCLLTNDLEAHPETWLSWRSEEGFVTLAECLKPKDHNSLRSYLWARRRIDKPYDVDGLQKINDHMKDRHWANPFEGCPICEEVS